MKHLALLTMLALPVVAETPYNQYIYEERTLGDIIVTASSAVEAPAGMVINATKEGASFIQGSIAFAKDKCYWGEAPADYTRCTEKQTKDAQAVLRDLSMNPMRKLSFNYSQKPVKGHSFSVESLNNGVRVELVKEGLEAKSSDSPPYLEYMELIDAFFEDNKPICGYVAKRDRQLLTEYADTFPFPKEYASWGDEICVQQLKNVGQYEIAPLGARGVPSFGVVNEVISIYKNFPVEKLKKEKK